MTHAALVRTFALAVLLVPSSAATLRAGSHLWKVHEIFSNAAGNVQYVELEECCGADRENFVAGIELLSVATESVFRFPEHLVGSTAWRSLLIGTEDYAAIRGAPQPDYVVPAGFFATTGDTIWYGQTRNYDSFTFGSGQLPLDGRNALHVEDWRDDTATPSLPSPTNYAGETGTFEVVTGGLTRGDCNADGQIEISDPVYLLHALFLSDAAPSCADACDVDDGGTLDVSDAVGLLGFLFLATDPPAAPWPVCGEDPAGDTLDCLEFPPCA